MIRLEKVSKSFVDQGTQQSIKAVDQVSLEIAQGAICGIIGYSGAGKSTLLRMINGLEKPTEGSVFVAEQEISQLSGQALRQARQQIGMIFQHFHLLWSRTVRENIAFPLEIAGHEPKKIKQKVDYLLERVGLASRADTYPAQLSGGQKQRVGIARALANDPAVLLCDEATSALDPETTRSILQLLQEINEELNLTLVLVTHEMGVVRSICEQMVVMDKGRVVEEGSVKQLFHTPQHALTKSLLGQTQTELEQGEVYTIRLEGHEWATFHQLLADHQVQLQIVAGQVQATSSQLSFRLQGEPSQIEKVKEVLQRERKEAKQC
jgi:D-methionine transport system ATP-binding protein